MNDKVFMSTTPSGIRRASCKNGEWVVEQKLDGMDVRCLTAHGDVVYAGTDKNGVMRSSDRGESWQPAGLLDQPIRALAASPVQPNVIYAGTKPPGLFVSQDGGAHWQELKSLRDMRQWWWFTPAESGAEYVQAIALSPTKPDVILVGIEFGAVLHSENGGQTWSTHRKGALRDCHSMTFHPTNGEWIYQGGGGGAAVSKDGGRTWSQSRRGRDRHYGWAVSADPERPEVWYMSAAPGPMRAHGPREARAYIFRSMGGAIWEKLEGDLPSDHMPYALLADAPGHLYAGLDNGDVWHSTDYGDHWQQLPFSLGSIVRTLILI